MSSKSLYVANKLSDADEFDRALDQLESRMKTAGVDAMPPERREMVLTPEELREIVSNAVTHAIAAYEHARNAKANPFHHAAPVDHAATVPLRLMPTMARLQDEMGLDDIEFEETVPAPVAVADLSSEAKGFVYQDPTEAALSAWDDALKRLAPEIDAAEEPHEG